MVMLRLDHNHAQHSVPFSLKMSIDFGHDYRVTWSFENKRGARLKFWCGEGCPFLVFWRLSSCLSTFHGWFLWTLPFAYFGVW